MTDFDPSFERMMLGRHGTIMADSLIAAAEKRHVDLLGLLTSCHDWHDWLTRAFDDGGQTRDLHFCNLSHAYASHFATEWTDAYQARRWKVTMHAIKLIGHKLYPPNVITWKPLLESGSELWLRSEPLVLLTGDDLVTVHFVIQSGMEFGVVLSAVSLDHLTEYQFLTIAGDNPHPQDYNLNDLLHDLIREGQGIILGEWTDDSLATGMVFCKQHAAWAAANWDMVMEHDDRKPRLFATGIDAMVVERADQRVRLEENGDVPTPCDIRYYECGWRRFTLLRTPIAAEPFQLRTIEEGTYGIEMNPVLVEGQAAWGSGLTWHAAEKLARKAILDAIFSEQDQVVRE